MYQVNGVELDSLASSGSSIHLTFFGLCTGGAVTTGVVLTTVTIANPLVYAGYIGGFVSAVIFAIYFGVRGIADHRAAKRRLKELKGEK